MNSSRKDSGWILCPSKSFPGKFYYFNVRNGEAVWGSNDIDNRTARKDTAHSIADKSHCYPEPSSPPLEEYPNISNIGPNKPTFTPQNSFNISAPNEMTYNLTNVGFNTPTLQAPFQKTFINVRRTILNQQKPYNIENSYQSFVQPSPQFGQTIFPKYVSNVDPYMQNVIWTPIQMPRPMILANTPIKTEIFDQNTQTWEDRCNVTVQSCNIPLSKRFVNYEEDIHKNNRHTEAMTSTQMFVPIDANIRNSNETNVQIFEPVNKSSFQPIKRLRTQSESDRTIISNDFVEKSKDSSSQMTALSPKHKVPFTRPKIRSDSDTFISNDLVEKPNISNDLVEKSNVGSLQINPTHNVPFTRQNTISDSNRNVISNDFVEKSNDSSLQIKALSPTHKVPFSRQRTVSDSDRNAISNDIVEKSNDDSLQIKALGPTFKAPFTRQKTVSDSHRSIILNDFKEKSKDAGFQNSALSLTRKDLFTRQKTVSDSDRNVISIDFEEKSNESSVQIKALNPAHKLPFTRQKTVTDRNVISNDFEENYKDTGFQNRALSLARKDSFTRQKTVSDSNRSIISNDFEEKSKGTSFQNEAIGPVHKVPFTRQRTVSDCDRSVISNDFKEKSKGSFQIETVSPARKVPFTRLKTLSDSNRSIISNDFEQNSKDTSFQNEAIGPAHKVPFTRQKTASDFNRSVISNDFEETSIDSFQIKTLNPAHKVLNTKYSESNRSLIPNDFEDICKDTGLQIKGLNPKHKVPITRPLFEKNESLKMVSDKPTVIKYPIKCHGGLERDDVSPKPTLLSSEKVEKVKDYDLLKNLGKNDLRFLILAKRRRSIDLGVLSSNVEGKKSKTNGTLNERSAQKKRVTFQISESSDTSREEVQQESIENDSQENEDFIPLVSPSESKQSSQYWYIIPDTEAVLEDFQEIEQLVQSDEKFRLMLPHAVRAQILNVSTGNCRGRLVIVARQLLRRLATLPPYIICQNPEHNEIFNKSTMNRILHCCLQLKENSHVILITGNAQLRKRANLNDILTHTLQDIKDGIVTDILKREHETYMKIKIAVKNDTNPNLFLQNIDEFNPFPLNKDAIFVNTFRIPLFKGKNVTDKQKDNTLINEDKSDSTNNIIIEIDSESSDVGVNIQNLLVKDKSIEKIKSNKIIFGPERDLINKNNIEKQSNKNRDIPSKPIETERSHQKSTKQNESKYEDIITPNQRSNDRKETTEERFQNIIINRTMTSKIDKFTQFNEKTNNRKLIKDTDVNQNDGRLNTVIRSEIRQVDSNAHRVVNIDMKSHNIPVQKDIRHNIDYSDAMTERINTNVDEKLKLIKNRLTKMVERPKMDHYVTNSSDEKLKKFQVRNEVMAETIKFKIEELVCTYTQVMEEALSCLLQNFNSIATNLSPPWTLHEVLTCIKKVYDNPEVRLYADELTLLILNNCCKQGKLQPTVKPNDFMRILGLGTLLIDFLKTLQPDCQDLTEAQHLLSMICENISSTVVDDIEPTLLPTRSDDDEATRRKYFMKTPADVIVWLKNHYSQWEKYEEPDTTDNSKEISQQNDMKVVRTSGKNINLLTINNTKSMTLNQPIDKKAMNNTETEENSGPKTIRPIEQREQNKSINKDINMRPEKPELLNKNTQPKVVRLFETSTPNKGNLTDNYIHIPTHSNTFYEDTNDSPKVIRNLTLIDTFEEKLKASNEQDYTHIDDTFSTFTFNISPHTTNDEMTNNNSQDMSIEFINNNTFNEYSSINNQFAENGDIFIQNNEFIVQNYDTFTHNNDTFAQSNDMFKQSNDTFAQSNDMFKQSNDTSAQFNDKSQYNNEFNNDIVQINDDNDNCVNHDVRRKDVESISVDDYDSGFENDNTQMYTVLKMFLSKLSVSLKMIYKFIDESILVFRDEKIQGDKLKSLQDKATQTHEHLAGIIYKLKSIIHRESGESSVLKDMLITSGITTSDKRMTRYKQVVTKCLEQAQMLENALKIMLTLADGDLDTPLYTHVQSPVYFNIFE